MRIVLVYNPKSGSALSKRELRRKCSKADIEIEAFIALGDGFESKLARYIKRDAYIAAIGGDGTLSAVANVMAGSQAIFIPLPGGTLNHFTKDLGIPQNIEEALGRLKKCKPSKIDIARVNDIFFINNSSIGLYPATLHDREDIEQQTGKWLGAVVAAFRALARFKTYRVTIDNITVTTPFVFVGNNHYSLDSLGGTERTSLNEGVLTVYIAKTRSRLTLLKIALFALAGKTKHLPEFDELQPKNLTIETRRKKLSVSHDGEVSKLTSPLAYKIHIRSLRVLA